MKRNCCIIFLVTILSISSSILFAQQDNLDVKNPISISCDLMSRYVWRGTDFGGSPSIQPGIEYSNSGFSVGAWGAYATNSSGVQETDLYISYTFKEILSLTLTDYFFPDELTDYQYFDYDKSTTGHILEATLSFNGTENFPFSILIATNIWGADAKKINTNGTTGNIQFSTYAKIAYSFNHLDLFMGTNLTSIDRDKGESGFYGDYMGIVNLGVTGTKEIAITDRFNLPLTVSLITNPQAQKIYFVAGISF